jgi:hypothetical protein
MTKILAHSAPYSRLKAKNDEFSPVVVVAFVANLAFAAQFLPPPPQIEGKIDDGRPIAAAAAAATMRKVP